MIVTTVERLWQVMVTTRQEGHIHPDSFICLVDDGSVDGTWQAILNLHQQNKYVTGLKLSRNFGHQNALWAGMMHWRGHIDCAITIDADLQQDENCIPLFIQRYRQGYQVVLGIRKDRQSDGFLKRNSARLFYSLMGMLGDRVVRNHADYRLLGRRALDALADFGEFHLFLRRLVLELGFPTASVLFDTHPRSLGETKYGWGRMLSFAWNGITSFSIAPLRLVTLLGILILVFSSIMLGYVLTIAMMGNAVPGWASTVVPIYLLGGIQILSLGIFGEYLGKLYKEVKHRPRYIVEEILVNDKE